MSDRVNTEIARFTFQNGDNLLLEYGDGHYAGIGEVSYIQLSYGEKDTTCYGTEEEPVYIAINTEYFHVDDWEKARNAFMKRMQDAPSKASGFGSSLEDIAARPKQQ